jgi:hypothetical protein
MRRVDDSIARIYSTTNPAEAEMLLVILRDHGIHGVIENQGATWAVGLATAAVPLVIAVSQIQETLARSVLRDAFDGRLRGQDIPAEMHVMIRCACGKELEIPPELKESGFECPWCGRPAGTAGVDVPP